MTDGARVRYRSMAYDSARWEGFALRPDDIIITTPPKCGTTWTQMICALLILQTPTFDQPLATISPWIDMRTRPLPQVVADLDAQQHRRVIKTHTPRDGLRWDDEVTYLCVARDPRDVALSFAHHQANMDLRAFATAIEESASIERPTDLTGPPQAPPPGEATLEECFWLWVDSPVPPTEIGSSLRRTVEHLASFWEVRDRPNVVLLHYADLLDDLDGQMHHLAERLAIDVPDDLWPALVEAATFARMKEHASAIVPGSTEHLWHSDEQFFNKGTSGQWRGLLDDDGQRRYDQALARLAPADLIAWLEHDLPAAP